MVEFTYLHPTRWEGGGGDEWGRRIISSFCAVAVRLGVGRGGEMIFREDMMRVGWRVERVFVSVL